MVMPENHAPIVDFPFGYVFKKKNSQSPYCFTTLPWNINRIGAHIGN